jgi:hypothetical protein
LLGAYQAGLALNASVVLGHSLAYVIAGEARLPHGVSCAMALPYWCLNADKFNKQVRESVTPGIVDEALPLALRETGLGVIVLRSGCFTRNAPCHGTDDDERRHTPEHHAAQLRAAQNTRQDWNVGQAELVAVERFRASPRRWRDKLVRLADLLPPNAVITSIAVNPDNLSGPTDINKLVISGAVKVAAGEDRMRGVVKLVNSLHGDSTFSAGYQNIQLTSSRATEAGGPAAEFVIECR